MRPFRAAVVSAACSLLLLSACGSDTTQVQSPPPVSTVAANIAAFQVRPVLRESLAPGGGCTPAPQVTVPVDQPVTLCSQSSGSILDLGAASVTSASIETIKAVGLGTGPWVLDVTLTDAGKKAFEQATTQLIDNPVPLNSLAILLDGTVKSVATVNEPITGGQIQVNGLTQEAANEFANRFTGAKS